MLGIEKPIPLPNEETEGYWEACHQGRLVTSRCGACGHRFLPPARICPSCLSDQVSYAPVSGRAKVFSWIIVHRSQHPAFNAETPYNVAIVELEEGPRMHTQLVGIAPEKMAVGMDVEVVFKKVDDEISLPMFKPVGTTVSF